MFKNFMNIFASPYSNVSRPLVATQSDYRIRSDIFAQSDYALTTTAMFVQNSSDAYLDWVV